MRFKVLDAVRDGIRRVNAARALLAGVFLVTLLLALLLGLTLRGMLADHLGRSLAADTAASGVNYDWWQEFRDQATGLGTTFNPTIIGFGAVLDNLSALADNRRRPTVIAGAAGAYLVVWAFLVGGILDRYARNRATRAAGFFSACGVFFFRFLRLGVLAWLAYYVLFGYVHGWLFDDFYSWATRDFTVERRAFVVWVSLYVVFGALLVLCNLILDYAKIRASVEDRRSMIGALLAGLRFVARHPGSTIGLYLLNGAIFLVVIAAYALVAPGAGSGGLRMWVVFLIGQAYVLARLWAKLLFYASQTAYTAAPLPVWPDSPAAEAIRSLGTGK